MASAPKNIQYWGLRSKSFLGCRLCWRLQTGGKDWIWDAALYKSHCAQNNWICARGLWVCNVTQYQGEALGGGSPSLDCCQRPLLHHILRLLIHSHHWLFGYPQQPRDQLIFTLHLFLSDRETSDNIYAGAKHLHGWFTQGADAKKLLCHSVGAVVMHMLCPRLKAPNGGGERGSCELTQ